MVRYKIAGDVTRILIDARRTYWVLWDGRTCCAAERCHIHMLYAIRAVSTPVEQIDKSSQSVAGLCFKCPAKSAVAWISA